MFERYTDSEHYVSMNKIKGYLESCGYATHSVTIKSDIEALIFSVMDIEYVHNKGYQLKSRPFTLGMLKILADVIASFRFLTVEDSEIFIKCLESLCSIYEVPCLKQNITMENRIKSSNEQIFENIDIINSALIKNLKISFDYYDYNTDKNLIKCNGGKQICLPFALVMNHEQYYVVSYFDKSPNSYTNFRLDHMKNIELLRQNKILPCEKLELESYIKASFSMLGGKSEYVTLRFPLENKYCNIAIDYFGKSVIMLKDINSNNFTIHVPIKVEFPQLFFAWIFSFNGKVEILQSLKFKKAYTKMLMENYIYSYI